MSDGSAVRQEIEALFAELRLIQEECAEHPCFQKAGLALSVSLEERGQRFEKVIHRLPRALTEAPTPTSFRPFLQVCVGADQLQVITDLLSALEPLRIPEPSTSEMASALVFDLRWIATVLREHLASRGGTASLTREDTHLASLADDLAGDLSHAISELMREGAPP